MTDTDQEKQTYSYAADAPIHDAADDRFRRWPFAQRIAQTIVSRADPSSIVIGIYGAWGEGKTSVLNFIEQELSQHPSVVCVRFNPWRFREETALLKNFFTTLANALDRSISSKKEKIGTWLKDYGEMLGAPLSALGLSLGKATAETGKLLSNIDLEELRNRIEGVLAEEKKRVVVLMDDIDRLDKDEIQAVFKLVKLSADFSYTAYVLAFDEDMVAEALAERYPKGGESGQNFLEKIVQVPLRLPPADPMSLRIFCFNGVNEAINLAAISLTKEQADAFARHFVSGIEPRLKTPRMSKRYANALSFALPILKGEVNPVDLMLIEGIRVFYPSLHAFIRKNRDLFTGTLATSPYNQQRDKDEAVAKIDSALEHFPQEAIYAKPLLTTLFPKLSGLYGNIHYGSEWEKIWANEQMVSSTDYFDRYFSYAIPEDDISDKEIDEFIEICNKSDTEKALSRLKELITNRNAEKVIRKMRYMESKLTPMSSLTLGKVLAISCNSFPNPEFLFSFIMPFTQASILIGKLARNIPKGEARLTFGKDVISLSATLPFIIECLRWLHTGKEKEGADRIFTIEEEEILDKMAADRIAEESKKEPIYIKYKGDAPWLLWTWAKWRSKEETEAYIIESIEEKPETVSGFLSTYVDTAWEMATGLPKKGDFERRNYDLLATVVDPEIIYRFIREIYGPQVESAQGDFFEYPPELESAEKLAWQFASIHHRLKAEKSESD